MFGAYLGLFTVLLIAVVGTAYFILQDKKHPDDADAN
jgi:hypothetical protein